MRADFCAETLLAHYGRWGIHPAMHGLFVLVSQASSIKSDVNQENWKRYILLMYAILSTLCNDICCSLIIHIAPDQSVYGLSISTISLKYIGMLWIIPVPCVPPICGAGLVTVVKSDGVSYPDERYKFVNKQMKTINPELSF
jgi:hypothetical protein